MKPIRVLLSEDHALVRSGIRALLRALPGVEVVGEAADGRQAVALAGSLHPDLVLMDLTMPELNGLEATARITREHPRVRVLILSMHGDEEYVAQAFRMGAAGYLLKDASSAELEIAIRAVGRGDRYLSPAVAKPVIDEYVQTAATAAPLDRLTSRQKEILQLVAEGNSTKEIARKLQVSVKTVETHRAQLMRRLDLHDVPALVRYAIRTGLVPLEQ